MSDFYLGNCTIVLFTITMCTLMYNIRIVIDNWSQFNLKFKVSYVFIIVNQLLMGYYLTEMIKFIGGDF